MTHHDQHPKGEQVIALRSAEVIDNEAADWLTKLDGGDLTNADRHALQQWLAQDPEHANALRGMAAMWRDMDTLLNDIPTTPQPVTHNPFSFVFTTKPMGLAFSALFICTLSLLLWMVAGPSANEAAIYVTDIGKQRVEQFKDGSSAHLNTNSMVETEFTNTTRIVRLLRGEALFDVAHDPSRPFIVYAGNRAVQALGTRFVVRLDSDNIRVTVTEGEVQLSKRQTANQQQQAQEVILLSKGEEVEVNDKTTTSKPKRVKEEALKRKLSWINGQLVFDNERLEVVIKEVSRYVSSKIIIDDPELRDIRISGRFAIGDTDALLEAIEVSFQVHAKHVEDQVIHLTQ